MSARIACAFVAVFVGGACPPSPPAAPEPPSPAATHPAASTRPAASAAPASEAAGERTPRVTQAALATMLKAPLTPRAQCAAAPMSPRRVVDLEVHAGPEVSRGALTRTLARLGAWGLSANIQFRIVGDLLTAGAPPLVPPPRNAFGAAPQHAAAGAKGGDDLATRLAALAPYFALRPGERGDTAPLRLVLTTALSSGRDPVQRFLGEGAGLGLCPSCPRNADSEALFSAIQADKSAPGAAFVNVTTATRDTAAHELGHAMGLPHHAERTHLMHPTPEVLCAPVLSAAERARYGRLAAP